MSSTLAHYSKELIALAPWGVPAVVGGAWFAWPALTENFKENTLGLKSSVPSPAAAASAAAPAEASKTVFRASGKYKFVRGEIGEAPTLEE